MSDMEMEFFDGLSDEESDVSRGMGRGGGEDTARDLSVWQHHPRNTDGADRKCMYLVL